MKGPVGLIVAVLLGVFGAALNWIYLQGKAADFETVSLLGIKANVTIQPGDVLREEHFGEVKAPQGATGDLKDYVYLYKDRSTIVGTLATRAYEGGNLVFRQDYRTPPPELKLAADERLIWVPVDSRSFVPNLVNPGDDITFILPRYGSNTPTPADSTEGAGQRGESWKTEMIGPFRVGSLGNRLGSSEVTRANRVSLVQERQVGIIIKVEGDQFETKAMRLIERLQQSDYRNAWVALHPRRPRE